MFSCSGLWHSLRKCLHQHPATYGMHGPCSTYIHSLPSLLLLQVSNSLSALSIKASETVSLLLTPKQLLCKLSNVLQVLSRPLPLVSSYLHEGICASQIRSQERCE